MEMAISLHSVGMVFAWEKVIRIGSDVYTNSGKSTLNDCELWTLLSSSKKKRSKFVTFYLPLFCDFCFSSRIQTCQNCESINLPFPLKISITHTENSQETNFSKDFI